MIIRRGGACVVYLSASLHDFKMLIMIDDCYVDQRNNEVHTHKRTDIHIYIQTRTSTRTHEHIHIQTSVEADRDL